MTKASHKTPTKYNREKEDKQIVLEECCMDIDEATQKLDFSNTQSGGISPSLSGI